MSPSTLSPWSRVRRSGYLRHTERPAEGCCRQALTRFAEPRCAGPDRRTRLQMGPAHASLSRLA
jgi:hypothetical protein